MEILFGIALDGHRPPVGTVQFGQLACGPAGLLDWLENRLGLLLPPVAEAQRIAAYREALEVAQRTGARFYTRSHEKDPLAVAETLLRWRDDLVTDGWDGTAPADASVRLRDLAAVEKAVAGKLPPGGGDRLRRLTEVLARCPVEVATIRTVEELGVMPKRWRLLLERLNAQPAVVPAAPANDSDLGRLQAALNSDGVAKKITLRGDGSVQLLTAYSEFTLAQGSAQWLAAERKDGGSVAVLADDLGRVLEEALLDVGEPALGIRPVSAARPIPQVLGLALRLHWRPLDPQHLLEFLAHPACPVTGWLRFRLARALQDAPGIGGANWRKAIEAARESVSGATHLDSAAKAEKLRRIEDDVAAWFGSGRHDPRTGAPGPELAASCSRVAAWAGRRAGAGQDDAAPQAEMFRALSAQAAALCELVKAKERVPRTELLRLLAQVSGAGCRNPVPVAEVGHLRRFAVPGAVIELVDTLLWWNFSEPSSPHLPHWTAAELTSLRSVGAEPRSPETILEARAAAWLRAVAAPRRRLVLACPRQRGGEPVAPHPLLARLRTLVAGELPVVDVDVGLRMGAKEFSFREPPLRPLPALQRWWRLPRPALVVAREEESFSSAEQFVFSPFAWVLKYQARLRAGSLGRSRPAAEQVIVGKLHHRVLDELLAAFPTLFCWNLSEYDLLDREVERIWPALCEEQAAYLLLPGHRAEYEQEMASTKDAMWRLFQHLRAAEVVDVSTNVQPPVVSFAGGKMGGSLDLLVKNEHGAWAVVDVKLGSRKKRREQLATNLHLQLAIYAHLHSQTDAGRWPEAAYFILNDAALLAQSPAYFPKAEVVEAPPGAAGVQVCWTEFLEVWDWRKLWLGQGWVEVNVEGTAPTEPGPHNPGSAPPLSHWQAGEVAAARNSFRALTGWAPTQ